MHTEIPDLDAAGLRRFGLTFAGIVAGLFGMALPLLFGLGFPWWPWLVGAGFTAWALIAPATMNGFYRLWMRFGLLLNAVMSRLVLGLVYYLTVFPTGLIMRLRGKDPMRRRFEPQSGTYRVESETPDPEQMRKPF
jgi:hypothetical protein